MKTVRLLFPAVFLATFALGQGTTWPFLSCVSSLELPSRGLLAANAIASGTVVATVTIGKGGALSKVELVGGDRALKGEVEVALRESRFSGRCTGKSFNLLFQFELQDPPTEGIVPPAIRFLPPNRFLLIFRRVTPTADPAPEKQKAQDRDLQ